MNWRNCSELAPHFHEIFTTFIAAVKSKLPFASLLGEKFTEAVFLNDPYIFIIFITTIHSHLLTPAFIKVF